MSFLYQYNNGDTATTKRHLLWATGLNWPYRDSKLHIFSPSGPSKLSSCLEHSNPEWQPTGNLYCCKGETIITMVTVAEKQQTVLS